jgi:hypothetical protein
MTPVQRTSIGVSLFVVGWVLSLSAALLAWNGIQRWLAVNDTVAAQGLVQRGRIADARELARAARTRVPEEAAPALLACDLAKSEDLDRLAAMAPRLKSHADRTALLATVGLGRTLLGKAADIDLDGSGDARLIAAIAAVRAGRTPGGLTADGETAPHLGVLRIALAELLRDAWQRGDAVAVRQHAGRLVLLAPRAPEVQLCQLLVMAGDSTADDKDFVSLVASLPGDVQPQAAKGMAAIFPQRRAALAAKYPAVLEGQP